MRTGVEKKQVHYILVGGGLQNGLLLLALRHFRPDARVTLIERGTSLGGNHTWSFHKTDLPEEGESWLRPLLEHQWPAYDVTFPNLRKRMPGGYASFSSTHFNEILQAAAADHPSSTLRLSKSVDRVTANAVTLASGEVIEGNVVIDARGPERYPLQGVRTGYQKFVGLELVLAHAAPRNVPMLMDATVPQTDGYRFFYTLPYSPYRVLIEDTYFSDSPLLDTEGLRAEVLAYAARKGYRVESIVREEQGVLPLPCGMPRRHEDNGALRAGYGGGWFHPATGYSFPVATRLAHDLAQADPATLQAVAWPRWAARQRRQFRYTAFLNWMLFTAFAPEKRWHVFERFYRLPPSTIEHFYAHQLNAVDMARIVVGRPPRGFSWRQALSGGTT